MTFNIGDINRFVTNCYFPIKENTFEKLQSKYQIEKGDWIIKLNSNPQKYWIIFKPNKSGSYNRYHLGLSHDPKNIFYWKNQLTKPQIIRQSDEKLKSIVLDCLDNRLKE